MKGGVNNGGFAHHQPVLGQMSVDGVEDLPRQLPRFQQLPELEQGVAFGADFRFRSMLPRRVWPS